MIYFIHIPKTAGCSMRSLFTAGLTPEQVALVYMPPTGVELDTLFALPRSRIDQLKMVFGHFHHGIDRQLARPGKFVTCLRETGSRLASNYYQHERGGFTGGLSLLDYVEAWKPRDMDNYSVRLLAGVGHEAAFGEMTEAHLRQAIENLDQRVAAFGLYEYMQETIAYFRGLGLGKGHLGQENVTPPAAATPIPAREIAALLEHNRLDVALYAHAKTRFEAEILPAVRRPKPASFLTRFRRASPAAL